MGTGCGDVLISDQRHLKKKHMFILFVMTMIQKNVRKLSWDNEQESIWNMSE